MTTMISGKLVISRLMLDDPQGPFSESAFVPDGCINPHPRFGTLVRNIRTRRGRKVAIRVPLFQDRLTPEFRRAKNGGGEG
jgi:glutamate--cysteine ligase catalytic subunit